MGTWTLPIGREINSVRRSNICCRCWRKMMVCEDRLWKSIACYEHHSPLLLSFHTTHKESNTNGRINPDPFALTHSHCRCWLETEESFQWTSILIFLKIFYSLTDTWHLQVALGTLYNPVSHHPPGIRTKRSESKSPRNFRTTGRDRSIGNSRSMAAGLECQLKVTGYRSAINRVPVTNVEIEGLVSYIPRFMIKLLILQFCKDIPIPTFS